MHQGLIGSLYLGLTAPLSQIRNRRLAALSQQSLFHHQLRLRFSMELIRAYGSCVCSRYFK